MLNYDLSPTVFNIFGAKARITNPRAKSKRMPKEFLTSVNAGADTGGVDRVDIHPPFFSKKNNSKCHFI